MTTTYEGYQTRGKRRNILGIVILLILLGAVLGVSFWPRNTVIIRNSTGTEIKNITLELWATSGDWSLTKSIASLNPNGDFRVRHSKNEIRAVLHFDTGGQQFEYHEEHIDLWQSEGWVFDIQQDGTVKAGYGQ